jgi:hypothetical protein
MPFEPGRDVDTIAEDVVPLDQHITDVDTDAPLHAAFGRGPGIPLFRQPLQPQAAFDGADHRSELNESAVAGRLDDPPAVLGDDRISSGAVLAQGLRRARFVDPHQPAVADHIGSKDRGEAAVEAIGAPT